MSKEQLSARVPDTMADEIEAFQDRKDIDSRAEALRQIVRRGLNSAQTPPGEQLAETATGVAVVGWVIAVIASALGQVWAVSLLVPFTAAVVVFSLVWASIRVLLGGALV